jgi:hypothetical protein
VRSTVSIVYVTRRLEPHFEWFADGLSRQLGPGDDVEMIVVDGRHSAERGERFAAEVGDRFGFRHVPPKPSPWNGPHRLTGRDYHSVASARNTGIVVARGSYVVFVDDLAVPMQHWWNEVCEAARGAYVVAGAYQKHYEMDVRDGLLVHSRLDASGMDARWNQGRDGRCVTVGGGQLFGCSFGAPREALVAVNGLDELCDPAGGEDYQLGLRLGWAAGPVYYSRSMLTIESEELHNVDEGRVARPDRSTTPAAYMARLAQFGVSERSIDGSWDSSHMVLDILFATRETRSVGNYYDLAELSEADLPSLPERFPETYWFDGTPLRDW